MNATEQLPPGFASSPFATLEEAPPDPILDIKQRFLADPRAEKVDLSVGVYQDGAGCTDPFEVVQEVALRGLAPCRDASYLGIDGFRPFIEAIEKLIFGSGSPGLASRTIVTAQTVGGTGALRCAADILRRALGQTTVYLPDPTWANHGAIMVAAGLRTATYPYLDSATLEFDFARCQEALRTIPKGSAVLLHACCHNPTGVDPSADQWKAIIELCGTQGIIPFVDFAYHGLKRGLSEDAELVRMIDESGLPFVMAYSCSKNFSLYRRRTGALVIRAQSVGEASCIRSQVKSLIRSNYSNPPIDGAAIVAEILGSPSLRQRWETELRAAGTRIRVMRERLVALLAAEGLGEQFAAIERQAGMFSYSGLSASHVRELEKQFGIYAVGSGRVCIAALNQGNIEYVARAMAAVVRAV